MLDRNKEFYTDADVLQKARDESDFIGLGAQSVTKQPIGIDMLLEQMTRNNVILQDTITELSYMLNKIVGPEPITRNDVPEQREHTTEDQNGFFESSARRISDQGRLITSLQQQLSRLHLVTN